jgi:protein-ribulosamine 3-kinase
VSGEFGAVAAAVAAALGRPVAAGPDAPVGGGSIHAAYRWPTAAGPLFVKLGPATAAALLAAEAHGLGALAAAGAIRVPAVIGTGVAAGTAWLALEWLALAPPSPAAQRSLGERLATLHRATAARFGFAADNFIGRTPQPNGWCDDWPEFLARRRLGPQLALAAAHGHGGRLTERGARLVEALAAFYAGYRPQPSLLHGDLWGGNRGALGDGTPVVFDPAPYYGDREADLAMTRLFGGFDAGFYAAYQASWPLDDGAGARVGLHQLYHVLNHLNLFGAGYAREALALIDRLLAAAGR